MRSPPPSRAQRSYRVVLLALKLAAIAFGLPVSVACVMAAVSPFSSDALLQAIPALVLVVGLPLGLAEWLGRDALGRRRGGSVAGRELAGPEPGLTDWLACAWLGFALLFVVGLHPFTQRSLLAEARILQREGVPGAGPLLAWLARGSRDSLEPEPPPKPVQRSPAPVPEQPPMGPAQALQALQHAVVTVSVRLGEGGARSASGFVAGPQGAIVTAASVVDGAQSVAVRLNDGSWLPPVAIARIDRQRGIALLAPRGRLPVEPLQLDNDAELRAGDALYVLGNPLGLGATLHQGVLLERRREGAGARLLLSAEVSLANLGGPVADQRGEVVGVAVASPLPGANLAAPGSLLGEILPEGGR